MHGFSVTQTHEFITLILFIAA